MLSRLPQNHGVSLLKWHRLSGCRGQCEYEYGRKCYPSPANNAEKREHTRKPSHTSCRQSFRLSLSRNLPEFVLPVPQIDKTSIDLFRRVLEHVIIGS